MAQNTDNHYYHATLYYACISVSLLICKFLGAEIMFYLNLYQHSAHTAVVQQNMMN